MENPHLLTVTEFCKSIGISRSTWHKLKRQGITPAIVNVGGIQRIRKEAIEEWLTENEVKASTNEAHKASEDPSPLVA